MLSEERVKHMVKIAMFEQKEMKKIQPVLKYSKKDYLGICLLANVFLASFLYLVAYGLLVVLLFSTVFTNLHMIGLVLGLVLGILLYIVYMYFWLGHIRKQYVKRYDEGVELTKILRREYQALQKMYEQEDMEKKPEGWE